MLECNIDDMDSEFYEYVTGKLFGAGALDVFITNILMKKGRPASELSVLANGADADRLSGIILTETTTIGIRKYPVEREALARETVSVSMYGGTVRVKVALRDGKIANYAPEYEDVRRLASSTGRPLKYIYNEAIRLFLNEHGPKLQA